MDTPLRRAITIVGGQLPTARKLGLAQPSVARWWKRGTLPATDWSGQTQYAEALERLTSGAVTVSELRPFPRPRGRVEYVSCT
jgi:DNA-binding transcriptional regulator YdaS (Cro superfamily)